MSTFQQTNILPPLPTLTAWLQDHLINIYKAKTLPEFDTAFDAFITKHNPRDKKEPVSIVVNGEKLGRDEYKKVLLGQRDIEQDVVLDWEGVVQVNGVGEADGQNKAVGTHRSWLKVLC